MDVFFSPCAQYCSAIDIVNQNGIGAYSGKTFEQLQAQYPDLQIVDDEVAIQHDRARSIRPPQEINEQHFWDMLECLPPCKWYRSPDTEAFHISERITHDIVTWCVRLGDTYYSLDDTDKLTPHEAIAKTIAATKEAA